MMLNQFFSLHQSHFNIISLVLLVLSLVFLVLLVIRLRTAKPAEIQECLGCRYPLKGLDPQTKSCPECGKKLTARDRTMTINWKRPGIIGMCLNPINIWASFAICFIGSVFFGINILRSNYIVGESKHARADAINIYVRWFYPINGAELTIAGKTILSRHVLDETQDLGIMLVCGSRRIFQVRASDQTFGFDVAAIPAEFNAAPGMTTKQENWYSIQQVQHGTRTQRVSVPVGHESIGLMLQSWKIDANQFLVTEVYDKALAAADRAKKLKPSHVVWKVDFATWPQVLGLPQSHPYFHGLPSVLALLVTLGVLVLVIRKIRQSPGGKAWLSTMDKSTTNP